MSKPEHLKVAEHLEHAAATQPDKTLEKSSDKSAGKEAAFDQYKKVNEEKPDESPYVVKQASSQKTDAVMTDDIGKSPLQIKYEETMANGLDASYQTMTPAQQEKFRKKGEEVAKQIEDLTSKLKLTAKKVLHLIRSWLRMIPGVNKYFLEQEAKLKTDAIMKIGLEEMLKRKHG